MNTKTMTGSGWVNGVCFGALVVIGALLQTGCSSTTLESEGALSATPALALESGLLGDLDGYLTHLVTLSDEGNAVATRAIAQMVNGEGMPLLDVLRAPEARAAVSDDTQVTDE